MPIALLKIIALSYLNTPYVWAANGSIYEDGAFYQAFDCSAYVQRVLRDSGVIRDDKDRSAQMLHDFILRSPDWHKSGGKSAKIVFYGKSTKKITHVDLELDGFIVGAIGGGRSTTGISDALESDARVKIREVGYRSDVVASFPIRG